jgi:cell division protein FtsW
MFKNLLNKNKRTALNPRNSKRFNDSSNSSSQSIARMHRPDYVLLIASVALLVVGLIVVYSISPGLSASQNVSQGYYIAKQIISIVLGLAAFFIISSIPLDKIKRSRRALIWVTIIMIAAVQLFGEKVNGAYRWIQIGGFSFQVAELIKFTLIIWLAAFLVTRLSRGEISSTEKTFKPLIIILVLLGAVVAVMESDLGSAGVMVAILAIMSFSAGLPIKKLAIIASVILIGGLLMISTTEYRRDRLTTFFNPTKDCQADGYQSCQALIAVGSGGVFGLGLGNSVQAYGYLPEAANDSIFAIIGEKFGFVGSSLVIGLYALLFSRMRRIVQCTQDLYSRLVVIGVLAWLSVQAIINIGAMIGLLPLKGITLPLISYGGTSLILVLAALGVVFRISRYTAYAPVRNVSASGEEGETKRENTSSRRGQRRPYYATASSR